jgi:sugar phosphate isomerase/epimerase
MQISFSTANLYLRPFEEVVDMIAAAGFANIELDLFWERKEWAMAQHLKDVPVKRVVKLVEQAGLHVSSIHDGGGVLEEPGSIRGFINPSLDDYLDALGYVPEALVFHTPHIEGEHRNGWWPRIASDIVSALELYRRLCDCVTIENMPIFPGYTVPLITPEELNDFARQYGLGITFDTVHYAQIDIDINEAARKLAGQIRTIHLSDYLAGRTHVFIGEGKLDFPAFFTQLDPAALQAVTLECSIPAAGQNQQEMSRVNLVDRMRTAHLRLQCWLENSIVLE